MIRDPELVKKVTTKDFDHFVDHREFVNEDVDPLFGKALFALKGSRWKTIRNVLSPAFTSSKMKAMFFLVDECAQQLVTYLEDKIKANGGKPLDQDMEDLFTRYANDVIATSAFGVQCDSLTDRENEFYVTGKESLDFGGWNMWRFLLAMLMPSVVKVLHIPVTKPYVYKFFLNLVGDTIRTREKEGIVRPDMIHLLMQARKGTLRGDEDELEADQREMKGLDLSDEDITSQVFLFFLAGFDTSSTLQCFLVHHLAVEPEIQRRLQQEIDDVLREDGGRLTYDGVMRKMKYLDMVVSETLRMWPPVLEIDRVCVKDYTVPATDTMPKVFIKKGQAINIPAFALHRDPELYPDPERFDPERFSEENKHNINQFAYLPFGTGPRACIGLRFALMATKIMVASVLSRFNVKTTPKTQSPLKLKKNTFNTTVEGGFWLALEARDQN